MKEYKCPVCGGTLEISLFSSSAVCESCGNRTQIEFDRTKEYRQIYHEAEKAACLNTVEGYTNAIDLLGSIPFVREAKDKTAIYQNRIKELRAKQESRKEAAVENSARDTVFGVVLIVMVVLIILAAVVAAVVIVVRLFRGELSTQSTIVLISVFAILVFVAIVGKVRGSF